MLDEDASASVKVNRDKGGLTEIERLLISSVVAFVVSVSKLMDENDIAVERLAEDSIGEDEAGGYEDLSGIMVFETNSDFLVIPGVTEVCVEFSCGE